MQGQTEFLIKIDISMMQSLKNMLNLQDSSTKKVQIKSQRKLGAVSTVFVLFAEHLILINTIMWIFMSEESC